MRLDLHLHTTASDGVASPSEVVALAVQGRLDTIAITDHDTTAGYAEAKAAADGQPLHVIPALELSTTQDGRDLHILGYFVDTEASGLVQHQALARTRRLDRIREMIANLASQGVEISEADVLARAGGEGGSVGRPHLAGAMIDAGVVHTFDEAFQKWIGDDHPAFVPSAMIDPVEGIELIREAGGVAIWAHPPRRMVDQALGPLVDAGLMGIEVYRRSHSAEYTASLAAHCARLGLVRTGGSDWHGEHHGPLGGFFVEADEVAEFLDKGGL